METELYSGPDVAAEDVVSVYVIVNGSLGMSPGKIAAMTFHCGTLIGRLMDNTELFDWKTQGRRVVVRYAETEHVFNRITEECNGITLRDEGLTEVEYGAATAYVTFPYRRADVPKVLMHKKCQLY